MTDTELVELFAQGPAAGERAAARRRELFGNEVTVCPLPAGARAQVWPATACIVRDGESEALPDWPGASQLRAGDHVVVNVPATERGRADFATYLHELSHAPQLPSFELAPGSEQAAGLHPLWTICAARLALPAPVRVVARHDLIGIRVAQIALTFGADTLCGPVEPDRALPLAGITRPNERTLTGLTTLVTQARLIPKPTP